MCGAWRAPSKIFHTAYGSTLPGLPYDVWKCRGGGNGLRGRQWHEQLNILALTASATWAKSACPSRRCSPAPAISGTGSRRSVTPAGNWAAVAGRSSTLPSSKEVSGGARRPQVRPCRHRWRFPGGVEGIRDAARGGLHRLTDHDRGRRGLTERPAARPKRVLVIGGGFTGSEIASACRERGLEVTVAERGPAHLMGVPGDTLSKPAAVMPRNHGVDLRTGVAVTALRGNGSFTGAELSDGSRVDARICASWHWAR
ncbi:FAD-dependent oxidoreductase [Streptomyces mirabilis]|uniref:FAD-dependent oxidoreductase n=1 Tax=Streptomyces mirabilis TaxID=68239 RepID=UPI0036DA736B